MTNGDENKKDEVEIKADEQVPGVAPENRPWVKKDMSGRFIDKKPKFTQFRAMKKIVNRKNP